MQFVFFFLTVLIIKINVYINMYSNKLVKVLISLFLPGKLSHCSPKAV